MRGFCAPSINALQRQLCQALVSRGQSSCPRGLPTRELIGVSLELTNPRCRLTTLPGRNWHGALAVGELCWHLRGHTDVAALAFYAPRWRQFAQADGQVLGSCYGARIFGAGLAGASQWDQVLALLRADPDTRRAVLDVRGCVDSSAPSQDVPCTNTLQFLLREGRLHALVSMRSNDVVWGVPYDVFLFTCLQELMALELGVEVGSYHHVAGSLHAYGRHEALVARLARSKAGGEGAMAPMQSAQAVRTLAAQEPAWRERGELPTGADGFVDGCRALLASRPGGQSRD